MTPILRVNHGYVTVLCPKGHLLTAHKADSTFGGSQFEADLSFRKWSCLACDEAEKGGK